MSASLVGSEMCIRDSSLLLSPRPSSVHSDDRTVAGEPVGLPTGMQAEIDRGVTTFVEAAHELEVGAFDLDW
eukprot:6143526-Alexandrium_andersonii.AAC.1